MCHARKSVSVRSRANHSKVRVVRANTHDVFIDIVFCEAASDILRRLSNKCSPTPIAAVRVNPSSRQQVLQ